MSSFDEENLRAGLARAGVRARLHCLDRVDSTNRFLWRALDGAEAAPKISAGTIDHLVLADQQCGGYGRYGRAWHSPAGVNLYLSVHFCFTPSLTPGVCVLAAAVAAHDALRRLPAVSQNIDVAALALKWPNDLVVGGAKLAGFLLETRLRPDRLRDAVLGVGVNVNMTEADIGAGELDRPWTSLYRSCRVLFDRAEMAATLAGAWQAALKKLQRDGPAPALDYWRRHDSLKEQTILVRHAGRDGSGHTRGVYAGLDELGRLRLRTATGVDCFDSAEVSLDAEQGA